VPPTQVRVSRNSCAAANTLDNTHGGSIRYCRMSNCSDIPPDPRSLATYQMSGSATLPPLADACTVFRPRGESDSILLALDRSYCQLLMEDYFDGHPSIDNTRVVPLRPSPILSIARQRNSAVTPGKLLHGKDIYIYALNRKWDTDDMLHQTELSGISNRKSGTTRIVNGPAYQIR
jgi:hypothetical protein